MVTAIGKEKSEIFVKEFLEHYLALGFGNLPKKEIDILVFGLMKKSGCFDGDDFFHIAQDLRIDEKKVKKNILEYAQRYASDKDSVNHSMNNLCDKIFKTQTIKTEFDIEKKTVAILIDDPIEQRDFSYFVRNHGYSLEGNLSRERFKMPVDLFISIFCEINDALFVNFKKYVKANMKGKKGREKLFDKGLPISEQVKNGISAASLVMTSVGAIATILGI